MGIPAFYRWLLGTYPETVVDVIEDSPQLVNGAWIPVELTKPNPNGLEFDNLYLDMNGIIHPCFHPENGPSPKSYDDIFPAIFEYIDRIFSLVRPRKLLFMAIDGVAPRAKMNQQRTRRFRAAKEAASMLEKQRKSSQSTFLDSNIITPGTEFMELLSSALHYYVHLRMNRYLGWKGVKVILSDATVPGEGEHKIMSYIRLQRNLPGFDPNTRHCLYGLDADLIMLGLATHEVHFSVLRESVMKAAPWKEKAHNKRMRAGSGNLMGGKGYRNYLKNIISKQKFQFLHVWILRDYLAESLRIPDSSVEVDLERLIDDFVFMCIFIGNDFLPHVPSLEISEGAIDLLMSVYKAEFVRMGGYLTNASEVNLKGVEHFVLTLGAHENSIFKKRRYPRQGQISWDSHARCIPAKNNVNLGEEGCKERYYTEKFQAQNDDDRETARNHAVLKYVEGICWIMHYYYQGVCSWQWFYPHHYAPFASDFRGLDQLKVHFELGKPFKPFDQLMGVLPAASAGALPLSYRTLMTDPSSPILDFYPTEFDLDFNGRMQPWKAVCILPFIDEPRLLCEIAKVENTLTDAERRRNTLGSNKLFIDMSHPLAAKISTFWERNKDNPKLQKAKVRMRINPKFSGGMNGYVYISEKHIRPLEIPSPSRDMETITGNIVSVVLYKFPDDHPHIPRPPEGVRMPKKIIGKHDVAPVSMLWHEKSAIHNSRYTSRSIPPMSIGRSCPAHQRFYCSEDKGNSSKGNQDDQLISGINGSEDKGNAGERSYDDQQETNQSEKKESRRSKGNAMKGSHDDQLISGINGSEEKGNAGERSYDDQQETDQSGKKKSRRSKGNAMKGSNDDQLISGINGSEDKVKAGERSYDDQQETNQSGKKKSRHSKRNAMKGSHDDQLTSGINGSEDKGNADERSYDDQQEMDQSEQKKSRRSKRNAMKGSHDDQLISGINGSEDKGNAGERSYDDQQEETDQTEKKKSRRSKGNVMKGIHDDQLISGINCSEDKVKAGERSYDDQQETDQSGKKKSRRSKGNAMKGSHDDQLISGINGNEDKIKAGKRSYDDQQETDQSGKRKSRRSKVNAMKGSHDDQLISGINGSEDKGNAGERSYDDQQETDQTEKKKSRRSKGNAMKGSHDDQLISGINGNEDKVKAGERSYDDQQETNQSGKKKSSRSKGNARKGSHDDQLISDINGSGDKGNAGERSHDDQLISGINISEDKGNARKRSHDDQHETNQSRNKKKRRNKNSILIEL